MEEGPRGEWRNDCRGGLHEVRQSLETCKSKFRLQLTCFEEPA